MDLNLCIPRSLAQARVKAHIDCSHTVMCREWIQEGNDDACTFL